VKLLEHPIKITRRLAGAAAVVSLALVLMAVGPAQALVKAQAASSRQQAFAAAAHEFGVPQELLLAISYNQSRWENHKGQPSVAGGYGLMHLTAPVAADDGRGDPSRPVPTQPVKGQDTLGQAADLLKLPVAQLKTNDAQNIRGGAAVLTQYAKQANGGALPTSINDWYTATARLSGATTTESATDFADSVYATLASGASLTTTDGQQLVLSPQKVQPQRSGLGALGLPSQPKPLAASQTDCPATLNCHFVPARYAQNDPANPANYGNYDTANRPSDMQIKYIVIHDTEGSYQSAIDWFQNPASFVSAHYVIRSSDGDVTQMVRTKDVGWHAGNWYMNMHSIGIEHEGVAAEGGAWYTEAMYRSSAKLVRYLADRYGVSLDRQHIIGHEQVPPINPARAPLMHYDPGPFWDWTHYMDLLHGHTNSDPHAAMTEDAKAAGINLNPNFSWWGSSVVKIAPDFAHNQQPVTACASGVCAELPPQGTDFVYLRTQPSATAPLLTDAGLHPDGSPGTTVISDWSAKALTGQRFVVAEKRGDWTAIWFNGQKGWFFNPVQNPVAKSSWSFKITPKQGMASAPVYGRPVPEPEAFTGGTTPFPAVPLQYTIPAGQSYSAYEYNSPNDYYQVLTFDRSAPGDGTVVMGHERYIPIDYNHRQAFVKASDVNLSWW
jgi:N-acetyl-anhydromuramyl-L-alanine amidase AmpD